MERKRNNDISLFYCDSDSLSNCKQIINRDVWNGICSIEVFMGIVLITTGIWTKLTAEDYYIDKEGRKKSLWIENELFFIRMAVWGLILSSVGVGLIMWGVITAF